MTSPATATTCISARIRRMALQRWAAPVGIAMLVSAVMWPAPLLATQIRLECSEKAPRVGAVPDLADEDDVDGAKSPAPAAAPARDSTPPSVRDAVLTLLNEDREKIRQERSEGYARMRRLISRLEASSDQRGLFDLLDVSRPASSSFEQRLRALWKRDFDRPGSAILKPFATGQTAAEFVACLWEEVRTEQCGIETATEAAAADIRNENGRIADKINFLANIQSPASARRCVERTVRPSTSQRPSSDVGTTTPYIVGSDAMSSLWGQSCLQSSAETSGRELYHPAVAAVLYDDGRTPESAYCTGTLIAPNLVLTAAHCICDTRAKDAGGRLYGTARACAGGSFTRLGRLQSTLDPSHQRVFFQHAGLFDIAQVIVHPQFRWTTRLPFADLAILVLEKFVSGIDPVPLNVKWPVAQPTLSMGVGFGVHNPIGDLGAVEGSSRILVGTGLKLQARILARRCGNEEPLDSLICWVYREQSAGARLGSTCMGDSGGPLFVRKNGSELIAGVTSAGGPTCTPSTKAYDTDIFAHRHWLMQQISMHATAARAPRPLSRQSACTLCRLCGAWRRFDDPAIDRARRILITVNCMRPYDSGQKTLITLRRKVADNSDADREFGSSRSQFFSVPIDVQAGEKPSEWKFRVKTDILDQCQIVVTSQE